VSCPPGRTPRILVADGGDHYKILEQIYHLLHPHGNLTFYIVSSRHYDYRELFPSAVKTRVITSGLRGIPFYFMLLFRGARYDVINISTGPDGTHYTDLFRILCFHLCCLLYRHKIIFTVRNTLPYLPSTPGLFASIRSRSLRLLKRFTFETATMRDAFVEASGIRNALLGVSYDRYSDLLTAEMQKKYTAPHGRRIRIGLLGSVNELRRDYGMVAEALATLGDAERSRLMFVTLGMCMGGREHPAIARLAAHVEVDVQAGVLSEDEFVERGCSCDLLISPLTLRKAYGVLNGSGSFGDAIFLRKKMILPRFADPRDEFAALCIYYADARELADVFRNAERHLAEGVPADTFERFTTRNVFKSLRMDLRLGQCEGI
jgi:hypothetical protein